MKKTRIFIGSLFCVFYLALILVWVIPIPFNSALFPLQPALISFSYLLLGLGTYLVFFLAPILGYSTFGVVIILVIQLALALYLLKTWDRRGFTEKVLLGILILVNGACGLYPALLSMPTGSVEIVECPVSENRSIQISFYALRGGYNAYLSIVDGNSNTNIQLLSSSSETSANPNCQNIGSYGAVIWLWSDTNAAFSTDNGQTWHVWSSRSDVYSSEAIYRRRIDSVTFTSNLLGEIVINGNPDTILQTTDGGTTWERLPA